ncbi:SDR family oxidoreductase [Prescottella agglutinans]|uniref:NAD(P)-dependent dehydrogenase (Short-subunit alcohol dehydrogenase family) n=1 Tax=Prescottella agglutinans TaxID=1644129 RepID=A0ABT6M4M5_9NOCA|nr:SDR family oxidoreductase [Prescottella agglutinans]MDH6279263.1 NAD(P)-dependent dehydrogenase (short-subunit alcohol dehydrogenase family) [Prescottella agglutinans]
MATYIVTGGTGFLGRHTIERLLERDPSAQVHVLVRPGSVSKLERLARSWNSGDRVHALVGDLTEPGLGLEAPPPAADHVVHLGAIYDLTAGEEQASTNIDGTRSVIDLAAGLGATLHHVSSIAVAGDHRGRFTEDDFDLGQHFPTPYHRTKFEAERLVRASDVPWRIYRPAAVVGSSVTGEMDKIDGPYYLFPALAALAKLPSALPVAVPKLGYTNVVPVDFVAAALVELMLRPGLDERAFHLVSPDAQPVRQIYAALAKAAHAPTPVADLPGVLALPLLSPPARARGVRDFTLRRMGIPPIVLDHLTLPTRFTTEQTRDALQDSGISAPPFPSYAAKLWAYWREHLDPDRARRDDPAGPLVNRHVLITGASSGIGRAAAIATAAKGATVLLLARRADELDAVVSQIRDAGGSAYAYQCDITDSEAVEHTVKSILAEHDHVDMLVNNAGRSIRRGLYRSTDRLHDFERTMAVNYFGAVRMVLALLPHMRERRFGHIVDISTAGVQARTPRFAAYIASKSALDAFADVAAAETLSDGITFTTIHMPLVRTPMIAPTGQYNAGPAASPEKAAAMVVRALIERPKRIDVPVGTLAEFGAIFAPRLKDRALSQMYHAFPDSPAARGEAGPAPELPPQPSTPAPRPTGPTASAARIARRLTRLIPGTHW